MSSTKQCATPTFSRGLKRRGSARELVTKVMARMRNDEQKLIRQMKKLINERKSYAVQIMTTDIGGWTPLHACVLQGSEKLLKVYLTSGVDVNTQMGQPEGLPSMCTPLHLACLRGDMDIINLLLTKGADIEAVDSCNRTPVTYAANRKHKHVVRLLREQGATMATIYSLLAFGEWVTPKIIDTKFSFF